jgi:pimeloyl-ACP methyl ester carboxylesterase
MDLPGFGLTGPAPDADYTAVRYSRFILDLMDRLRIKRAILVGNSLGGGIAWLTAVRAPNRVAGLVLVDSAGYPEPPVSVPIGFRLVRVSWLAPLLEHMLPRGVIAASLRNVYGDPSRVTPALIDQYYEMTLRAGNRHALRLAERDDDVDGFAGQIRNITQPTLILWGGRDRLIPPGNAARFHADIAHSQVVMFDTLGHVPQEEAPAATLAATRTFLTAAD